MADWQAIETEYITTDTSYRKLSEKYGIAKNRIAEHGRKEGWKEKRARFKDKTVSDSVRKISSQRSTKAARIDKAADRLIEKLEKAIDELDLKITTRKIKEEVGNTEITTEFREATEGGIVDRAGLRQLTAALKDLKEVKGILSDLDKQEKKARIDNLRRQAAQSENAGGETMVVQLEGGVDEYAL